MSAKSLGFLVLGLIKVLSLGFRVVELRVGLLSQELWVWSLGSKVLSLRFRVWS